MKKVFLLISIFVCNLSVANNDSTFLKRLNNMDERQQKKILQEEKRVQLEQEEKSKIEKQQVNKNIKEKQNSINSVNSEKISVYSIEFDNPEFTCGRQWNNLYRWWEDKYCVDESKWIVSFKSKNNLNVAVKDVKYECNSIAKSGTVIGSEQRTIFDTWSPGSTKNIELTISAINQTSSLKCIAKSWK